MVITATEIDNNNKSIDKQLEAEIIKKIKSMLMIKVREFKKQKLSENENYILTKEDKDLLKQEILNSDELKEYRIKTKEFLISRNENYYVLRQDLNGLNELNEFSAEIERTGFQTVDNFKSFGELLKLSVTYTQRFNKYKEIRINEITEYVDSYKNKKLSFNETSKELLQKLFEIYKVTKDMDDIDVFDKFGMESNIDISNKLSDICFSELSNNNNLYDNFVNRYYNNNNQQTNNIISKLSKQNIISTKMLGLLLLSGKGFITNNSVTCYNTMYDTTKTIKSTYVTRTLGELFLQIINPRLKDITKESRQQIYMTYDGTRGTNDSYYKWNGLQIFDIDLKEWEQINLIDILKRKLFEYLQDFHWFLWIVKSASGKGIHIYTKVSPPHHVYTDVRDNEYISKYWYHINYIQKVSIIYDIFKRIDSDITNNIQFNCFLDNFELKYLDGTVGRISSGIRLTFDDKILVNHRFMDLHPAVNLSQTLEGYDNYNYAMKLFFRNSNINNKLLSILNDLTIKDTKELKIHKDVENIDLTKYDFTGDFSSITPIPRNSINYLVRYNVVNTLAALFGKEGIPLAHKILQSDVCKNEREINSFYTCAISNKKNPTKLGLDILKKVGCIKTVKPEVKESIDNIFKNGIKKAIESALDNQFQEPDIILLDHEYLSDKMDYFMDEFNGGFTNEKINILLSPAGSGKTHLILELASHGKRLLLVEPFISVIKNKVESNEELMKIFQVFYEGKQLNDIDYGINGVTTFDKFSRCNYEKVSRMFDYICIDESHLLFTSSYRIEATSNAVRKIKELFYISSNDPTAAKIILMTGTETGDSYFFGDISNVIKVYKKSLSKEMEFLICDDNLDCITRLAYKTKELIQDGYRLIIPTNKGEIYSHKLIGMIEYLLNRPVKFGYYKRSNVEQEICEIINKYNTIGDYEIMFCSNYLSVGVDITDSSQKFASIYFGPFSGYEIEQFNARIRKQGIKSIYCIQTEKNDGTVNDLLIEEPNLVLKLNEDDIEHFLDDKEIAKAKQEFIAQYDPILHKIITPGFSYLNGAIRFNQEEYELIMFETKFLETMIHPVKIARELAKYGYTIKVCETYNGLTEDIQEKLKSIGIQSAKEEKIRKHNLLVGTYLDLIDNNYHITDTGLEFNDVIVWIGNNKDKIIEDRESENFVTVNFNYYGNPEDVIVKSKEALEKMWGCAKYIIGKYSPQKAKDIIYRYVDENGILKQKYFRRAINLMKLVESADNNDLSEPMFIMLEKLYDWIDKFQANKRYRISYNTFNADIDAWTQSYIDMLKIKISSTYGYQKIKDNIIEMLNNLATKNTSKEGIRYEYNKLPDEDGMLIKNRKSVDMMVENMFRITSETITQNKRTRNKHIVLETQAFS